MHDQHDGNVFALLIMARLSSCLQAACLAK